LTFVKTQDQTSLIRAQLMLDHQFDLTGCCLDDDFDLAQNGFKSWALATGAAAQ
jgi:hypothetical protein